MVLPRYGYYSRTVSQEKTGYKLPEDLAFKQQRLRKIKAAKKALEAREEALNPGKPTDAKKQISFADTEARIMGNRGDFAYRYNGQVSVDSDHQAIVGQHLSQYLSQNANDKQEVKEGLKTLRKALGNYRVNFRHSQKLECEGVLRKCLGKEV